MSSLSPRLAPKSWRISSSNPLSAFLFVLRSRSVVQVSRRNNLGHSRFVELSLFPFRCANSATQATRSHSRWPPRLETLWQHREDHGAFVRGSFFFVPSSPFLLSLFEQEPVVKAVCTDTRTSFVFLKETEAYKEESTVIQKE
jgi:hypothetical protein